MQKNNDNVRRNGWTEEEIEILKQYYPTEGKNTYKRLPGRSVHACHSQAKLLGIISTKFWTKEEDDIIRKYYPTEAGDVYKRLEGRTKDACRLRAKTLKINATLKSKQSSDILWTKEEDDILREYYPTEGTDVYKRLNGRTTLSCMSRARNLKIKYESSSKARNGSAPIWADYEDEIIRKYYPYEGSKVRNRLEGRSIGACHARAQKLGVKYLLRDSQMGILWTKEEDDILREYYPTEGTDVYKRLNGRTKLSVLTRARFLEIKYCNTEWTDEELNILREYYPSEGSNVYKRLEGRSKDACVIKAGRLGLNYKHSNLKWSKEDDDIIRKYYPTEAGDVYKRLEGRTKEACRLRAKTLGIKCKNTRSRKPYSSISWTREEDDILREYYPTERGKICKRLPNKKINSIYQRVHDLGISGNIWSEEDDNILRKYYPIEGISVRKRLIGKTDKSIYCRVSKLGVKKS